MKSYYIYILSNKTNSVLYTGITSNVIKRIYEHKHNLVDGFTKKYLIHKLIYYEQYQDIRDAMEREKQLKAGSRKKKESLVTFLNPEWKDLYDSLV